jgi:hypothetical protein
MRVADADWGRESSMVYLHKRHLERDALAAKIAGETKKFNGI